MLSSLYSKQCSKAILSRYYGTLTPTSAQRKTIYALSTPPGKGGVAVVRISGPDALQVWRQMVRSTDSQPKPDPKPWKLQRCHIVHPKTGALVDDGLAVYFKGGRHVCLTGSKLIVEAPYSFTTQPSLELHVHSGRALITSLLSSLAALPFLRPAEPGEFTRQAFLGGRIDLTQVEGLQDLIDADTEVQRVWALESAAVCLGLLYNDSSN